MVERVLNLVDQVFDRSLALVDVELRGDFGAGLLQRLAGHLAHAIDLHDRPAEARLDRADDGSGGSCEDHCRNLISRHARISGPGLVFERCHGGVRPRRRCRGGEVRSSLCTLGDGTGRRLVLHHHLA